MYRAVSCLFPIHHSLHFTADEANLRPFHTRTDVSPLLTRTALHFFSPPGFERLLVFAPAKRRATTTTTTTIKIRAMGSILQYRHLPHNLKRCRYRYRHRHRHQHQPRHLTATDAGTSSACSCTSGYTNAKPAEGLAHVMEA